MLEGSTICDVWTSQRPTGNERNRTVPRRHGCTERPEPPFEKLLYFQHRVSGLLFPRSSFAGPARTDFLNTDELHNASVDEASKLEKTRNK
jgi:hypothetical protein